MLIKCPSEFTDIYVDNKLYYSNRVVNLSQTNVLGKSISKKEGLPTFYTIRFSHTKNHSTEWYFTNKGDRDTIYEIIMDRFVKTLITSTLE